MRDETCLLEGDGLPAVVAIAPRARESKRSTAVLQPCVVSVISLLPDFRARPIGNAIGIEQNVR